MYEHKSQPLATRSVYYKRILRNFFIVSIFMVIMLGIGTFGYHYSTKPFSDWYDSFHNASMILSGMGPVMTENFTKAGKIFSSFYALFSGIVFIGAMGFIFAPALHRIFDRIHLEES